MKRKYIFIILFLLSMLSINLSNIFLTVSNMFTKKSNSVEYNYFEEDLSIEHFIEKNLDLMLEVRHSWEEMDLQKREEVARLIADFEQHRLGLQYNLTVSVVKNYERDAHAYYSDKNHSISIREDTLESVDIDKLLEIICHEGFHCFEYRLTEVYDFVDDDLKSLYMINKAAVYKYEFQNYVSQDESDFDSYYNQKVEEDAREYAEKEAGEIYDVLCSYY